MDRLTAQQQETGSSIEKIIINYKKDSASRKTAPYYEQRIQKLATLWQQFEETDNAIRALPNTDLQHAYFAKDYYNAIQTAYDEYYAILEKELMEIKSKAVPDSADAGETPEERQHPGQKIPAASTEGTLPISVSAHDPTDNSAIDEITKLIRRQRANFQSLCHILNGIEKNPSIQSKQYCNLKSTTIQRQWGNIEECNSKIWELSDNLAISGYETDQYFELEERVQSALIALAEKLDNLPASTGIIPTPSNMVSMKLPKLVIPTFDGDYLKWRQFYDLFTQMVHNQAMGNCQKMWYLKTNLTGEAEKLIRHFSTSDDNYVAAWNTLKNRYNNTRLLVTALLNKLLSQPKLATEGAAMIKALHDTTQECLMGLENIGVPTTNWDPILLHILLRKLDRSTHTAYEQTLSQPRNLQSIKEFLSFLETRFQSLEALGTKGKNIEDQAKNTRLTTRNNAKSFATTATVTSKCMSCKGDHKIFACQKFLQLSPHNRVDLAKKLRLCLNCLKSGHAAQQCPSRSCFKCAKRHNTLLHIQDSSQDKSSTIQPSATQSQPAQPNSQSVTLAAQPKEQRKGYVLLSTVRVILRGRNNSNIVCRAILDSGSQLNLITKRIAKGLGLTGVPEDMNIHGIGNGTQRAEERVSVVLESTTSGYKTRIEAFILPRILGPQPCKQLDISSWPIPQNISLADPSFNRPDRVDLLIGAELAYDLLSVGQIKLGTGLPTLQNTLLGWILAGKVEHVPPSEVTCGICSEDERLERQIEKFWIIEEAGRSNDCTTVAERRCEDYFNQTVKRNTSGRFVVRLPFLQEPKQLGESKDIAFRRFLSIERKLSKDDNLRTQYSKFMQEYRMMGHMEEVDIRRIEPPYYFLPHHCVIKPDSSTTKLRVVFDASCKTSTNTSLNDILAAGPVIQDELFTILLRFRMPRFVFTADIEKMFRQVLMHEDDRKFQLIYWRDSPTDTVKCYMLNTVTYGTKPASYLSTKCLQRLANDSDKYPLGSESLKRDFYVDDVMSGSDSLATALATQKELRSLLAEAGFKLRKWCANHPRLLHDIPSEDVESQIVFDDGSEKTIKILGLSWLPSSDSFCVKADWSGQQRVTKRIAYSDTARLFDPLGIMGPVVVTAKIFLQQLWRLKLDWDASLPLALHTQWISFREGLQAINNVKFPRHVFSKQGNKSTQLHVFADASQRAYGTAIYVRSINKDNQIVVRLLCAKSRVAPLKQLTLPRLELCAAKLAAQVTDRVKIDLKITKELVYFWSDSEIVLKWINSSKKLPTFVANRVSDIRNLSHPQQWRHVGSKQNPADILSRGLEPNKLESCNLWFYGPPFLHGVEEIWPPPFVKPVEDDSEEEQVVLPLTSEEIPTHFVNRIEHHNSFRRLKRVVAHILRFINRIKCRNVKAVQDSQLTAKELDEALMVIISVMQAEQFKIDIAQIKRHNETNKSSNLTSLAPFLDERGLIRVGGRLQESSLPYDAKHPLILPYSHHLTKLLMKDIHLNNHHAGPQALLSITQQRFWPIKGKSIARSVVQHCLRCARAKPKLLSQVMGNLPAHRVQPARPFVNAGVDFCGPIWIHYKLRGKRPQKSYIAVFCCFATKAIHLELVSDLSTRAFIGALKRFMARRGHCRNIYCDNATNFVGAKNELSELKEAIYDDKSKTDIARACEVKGTDFHFIPPRAPHFGGLWEAAVKSAKYLLRRTMQAASLTYEELETVVVEIEAILNSRPLTPMSSNPNDLSALTPGHFLIGEPLTNAIDANAEPVKATLLKRWELVSHLKNEFWKRWSQEYLNQLQQRQKWTQQRTNVLPGTLVIIKDDNLPPLKWPLGRITNVIKGRDGFARIADVRIANHNIIRRPIHSLAPLPLNEEADELVEASEKEQDNDKDRQQERGRVPKDTRSLAPDLNPTPQKRRRRSLGSSITMVLLALMVLPSINGSPIEIKPFDSHPGIHFENLGTTLLVNTQWNLVVYYDLEPYWTELKIFYGGTLAQRAICDLMQQRNICSSLITQFAQLKEKLSNNNEMLQPRLARARRAPFNIIGNIGSALFGILDSEYAEKMSRTIEDVKINENHLLTLIKNHTTLLDSTLNVVRGNQAVMRKQFSEFNDHIEQLRNRVNNMSQELHEAKLSELFIALSLQTMLVASNLQNTQTSILEVIADTHHGRISPQLISPQQLREAMIKIKEHLPPSLRLPVALNDTPRLYSLMNIQCQVTKRHVIFKLELPVPTLEEFELFRLIPVPVLINKTLVAIKPASRLLVVNLHRDQYYQLNEQELSACVTIEENTHMCRQNHPIYRRGADVGACEIHLMNQLPQPRTCQLMKIETSSQWIQLHDPNKWIYALQERSPINIVCGDKVSQAVLEGSGILKIQSGCVIKQERITIQGHNYYPSIARASYTPLGNITDFIPPKEISLIQHNPKIYQPNQTELDELYRRLMDQQLQQLPTGIESHDVHQFAISYIGLLGIVIIGGYFIWKYFPRKARKGPIPAPRRIPVEDFSVHIDQGDS